MIARHLLLRLLMLLPITVSSCNTDNSPQQTSSKGAPLTISFDQLCQKVNLGDSGVASTVPIPVRVGGRPAFVVVDYNTTLLGYDVGWPDWRRVFDASTFEELETGQFSSQQLGVSRPSTRLLKSPIDLGAMAERAPIPTELRTASGNGYPAFSRAHEQLWPLYFAGAGVTTAEGKEAATLILDRWDDQTEQGFRELYWAIGADWFSWLQRQREAKI